MNSPDNISALADNLFGEFYSTHARTRMQHMHSYTRTQEISIANSGSLTFSLSFLGDGPYDYAGPPCSVIDAEGCEHEYYLVYNENRYAILAENEESEYQPQLSDGIKQI